MNGKDLDVIITGATGMVGKGVMLECLECPQVNTVTVVNRSPVRFEHPKLIEILLEDFQDLSPLQNALREYDACFFCMGVSSLGLSEQRYREITYDITLNFAHLLLSKNSKMTFCYVSGTGTNAQGSSMWARVKGETENALKKLPFKQVLLFRPGYIQPLKGIKSKTGWYNLVYLIFSPLYPVIKSLAPNGVTDTTLVGQAMIKSVLLGYEKNVLSNKDINILGSRNLN